MRLDLVDVFEGAFLETWAEEVVIPHINIISAMSILISWQSFDMQLRRRALTKQLTNPLTGQLTTRLRYFFKKNGQKTFYNNQEWAVMSAKDFSKGWP